MIIDTNMLEWMDTNQTPVEADADMYFFQGLKIVGKTTFYKLYYK